MSDRAPPDHPLNLAIVPAARLGEVLGFRGAHDQVRIIRAIDEMISRG